MSSSKDVYMNVYGNTLKQIIFDFNKQVMENIEWMKEGNKLDEKELSNHKFLIKELKKALKVYIGYSACVPDVIEGIANYFNVSLK